MIKYNEQEEKVLFGRDVWLKIISSQEDRPQLAIVKKSGGYSMDKARDNAASIDHRYDFSENSLVLDGFFISAVDHENKEQEVRLNLYLPEGQVVNFDKNVSRFYLKSYDEDAYRINDSLFDHTLKFKENRVICLDCDTSTTENQTHINQ